MTTSNAAALVLADGTVFRGRSIGATGLRVGEVVFNTAMSGYQEILTDPSYCKQIVTLTASHVGNVGVNPEDAESASIHAAGLVVRDVPMRSSSWRATEALPDYLRRHAVVGIADIDTRQLTRHLRMHGAQSGAIVAGEVDIDAALAAARSFAGLAGMDLAREVSVQSAYPWTEGAWSLGQGFVSVPQRPFHVVAFDYGIKRNILRLLAARGVHITVLPAQTTAQAALALKPDGVFLSNGPGDPEPCTYAIRAIAHILKHTNLPIFGICLGHQLLALASGARTIKMKFGHHGANHPVKDLDTGAVAITSQNHGFAVDPDSLPNNLRVTHVSLFDGSIQGLARTDRAAFSFQGHPEASPGPHDMAHLFDRFITLMQSTVGAHAAK